MGVDLGGRGDMHWYARIMELKEEYPQYQTLPIEMIDEQLHPEVTKTYSYYYVPTYYVDGIKAHEGVPTKEIVREVFEKALA